MVLEISFTALNRLAALRLCEERGLVVECVRKGTGSAGFQMFERISGWLRAQKTWKNLGIKAPERPRIVRSNIVTAEPMPGEEDMRCGFTAGLKPRVLGQIVDEVFEKMKLAGEAGSLLKIEEEIKHAVAAAKKQCEHMPPAEQLLLFPGTAPRRHPARNDFSDLKKPQPTAHRPPATDSLPTAYRLLPTDFWQQAEDRILDALKEYAERVENGHATRRRLFAEDAARGFAFIDLCRKRYDVVLMNPPFGEPAKISKSLIEKSFPRTKNDVYAAFVERGLNLLRKGGMLGTITSRTGFFLSSFTEEHRSELKFTRTLEAGPLLGQKNVGGGVLPDFYLIPAVRDLTEEIKVKTTTTFGRLLNRAVREMTEQDPRFIKAKKTT
ncbi:MAG: hypothetical protein SWC40_03075 [Thermodesulfobacteriota bacterium]|nr:hypothetical protein [Thermodesulfobacteriota bacterium]